MRALFVIISLIPLLAFGQVYRQTAPDGTVIYTDKPSKTSEKVKLKPIQTYQAPKPIPIALPDEDKAVSLDKAPKDYELVRLVSPTPNQSIWSATQTYLISPPKCKLKSTLGSAIDIKNA